MDGGDRELAPEQLGVLRHAAGEPADHDGELELQRRGVAVAQRGQQPGQGGALAEGPPPSRSPQQRRFPRPPSSATSPPRNGLSCPATSSPRCSPRWPSSPPAYRCSPRSIGPSGTDWHNWNATTSRSAESSSPPFPNCALRNSTTSGAPSNCSRGPSPGGLAAPPVTSRSASSPARL